MRRISYNWFWESLSTLVSCIFVVTLGVVAFDYFDENRKQDLFDEILEINLIVTPIITLFWGLRPLFESGRILKTLYADESGHFYLNRNSRLEISKIEKLIIVHLWGGDMYGYYYKILFKPSNSRINMKTEKPVYLAEKFSLLTFFTHFFKGKTEVVDTLISGGLSPEQVVDGEAASNYFFWKKPKN